MGLDPDRAAVRAGVRRVLGEVPDGPVLVACSGGADSLALLAAAVFETRGPGRLMRSVVGVVVDHGLQEGSAGHTTDVVSQMARLGADETVSARVRVESRGQGPEAAAREARYAVLEQVAESFAAGLVLLGHTRDDQAETVLLGLTRGSGARSLAGMRRGFGVFRRPLLDVTRAQTEAACHADDLAPWTDPHNSDPRFTRVRVRDRVLPVLEDELGPGVAEALARTADALSEDAQALEAWAEQVWAGVVTPAGLDVPGLVALPVAVRARVLRRAALEAGCPPSELFRVHVRALVALLADPERGRKQVRLPGHVSARTAGDTLHFLRTPVGG